MPRVDEFVYANCVWLGDRFVACRIVGDRVVLDDRVAVDVDDRADACTLFVDEVDGVSYGGGESTAHGSCGFFFKKTGHRLDWALFSLESDPFVGVEIAPGQVRFISQSRDAWVVEQDDVGCARIVRAVMTHP